MKTQNYVKSNIYSYFLNNFYVIYVSSQTKFNIEKKPESADGYSNNIETNWVYFVLKDTLIAKVIEHNPASVDCGILATSSITVVVTNIRNTIRIIDLCNTSDNYKKDQIVKVLPATKPNFSVLKPYNWKLNPQTNKFELFGYDLSVLKTTWGELTNLP